MNRMNALLLSAWFLAVLVGISPAVSGMSDLNRASMLCDKGFKALETQDVVKAKQQFDKALMSLPAYPDGHLGLGHVAMLESRFEDALTEYQAARDGHAELADRLFEVAMENYNIRRQQVQGLAQEALDLSNGQVRMGDAEMRFRLQEIDDGIRELSDQPMPTKADTQEIPAEIEFHTGNALMKLRRWSAAVEAFEACTEKSSTYGPAYNNLALAYWRSGRPEDGLKTLARAEELGLEVNPRLKADIERNIK
jgi:tetratricopeptide (TPR) repeat protein